MKTDHEMNSGETPVKPTKGQVTLDTGGGAICSQSAKVKGDEVPTLLLLSPSVTLKSMFSR